VARIIPNVAAMIGYFRICSPSVKSASNSPGTFVRYFQGCWPILAGGKVSMNAEYFGDGAKGDLPLLRAWCWSSVILGDPMFGLNAEALSKLL
jgi:hypothetical protein